MEEKDFKDSDIAIDGKGVLWQCCRYAWAPKKVFWYTFGDDIPLEWKDLSKPVRRAVVSAS